MKENLKVINYSLLTVSSMSGQFGIDGENDDNNEMNDALNQPTDEDLLDYVSKSDVEDDILYLQQSDFN